MLSMLFSYEEGAVAVLKTTQTLAAEFARNEGNTRFDTSLKIQAAIKRLIDIGASAFLIACFLRC